MAEIMFRKTRLKRPANVLTLPCNNRYYDGILDTDFYVITIWFSPR